VFQRPFLPLLLVAPTLPAADKTTYLDHVLPVLEQACLNCHNPDDTKGGLDLSSYTAAMQGGSGGKIAIAGDAGSKIVAVTSGAAEPTMPPEGEPLSADQVAILRAWVEGGLLESKDSKPKRAPKPKFDPSLAGDATERPEGPPPMPEDVLLEPELVAPRPGSVHALAHSPWAPLLAVTGQRQVLLFDSDALELAGVLPFPEGDPVSLAFTPNGRYLIVGGGIPGKSGVTVSFDVVSGERALVAAKEFDSVLAADLRPDLAAVATGSPSRRLKLWNAGDGELLKSIKKHTDWVTALDYSPDGILLASGDRNGGIWVREAATGAEFHTLRGHEAGITALAFRADSKLLASASEDGSVRFWDMNSGNEVKKVDAHRGGVSAFAWARDGSSATVGRDRAARVWKPDFNRRHEIKDLPEQPTAVALNGDGSRLFVADYAGHIHAYSTEDAEPVGDFDANPPAIATRLERLSRLLDERPAALSDKRDAHEQALARVEERRQQLEHHQRRLAETRRTIADAEGRLDTAKREQPARQRAFDQTTQRVAQRQTKLDRQQQALDAATKPLRQLEQELEAIDDQARRALLAKRLEQARNRQQQARKQLARAKAELDRDRQALTKARADLDATREQLATATATLEDARPQLKQLDDGLEGRRQQLAAAEKQVAELAPQLEQLAAEIESLRQRERHWRAAELNSRSILLARDAAQASRDNEELAARFASRNREFNELYRELAKSRSQGEDDAALTRRLDAFADELVEMRDELDRQLPELDRLRRESTALRQQYLELKP